MMQKAIHHYFRLYFYNLNEDEHVMRRIHHHYQLVQSPSIICGTDLTYLE